ncbi:hypothetical protein EDD17DRAFT_1505231 [Pisolithus thermaeus]|nr:hypothetical protein EDD17DRAFT_1505231 [Pisolithus thermaeus]
MHRLTSGGVASAFSLAQSDNHWPCSRKHAQTQWKQGRQAIPLMPPDDNQSDYMPGTGCGLWNTSWAATIIPLHAWVASLAQCSTCSGSIDVTTSSSFSFNMTGMVPLLLLQPHERMGWIGYVSVHYCCATMQAAPHVGHWILTSKQISED